MTEGRFHVYKEAPGFRPGPHKWHHMTWTVVPAGPYTAGPDGGPTDKLAQCCHPNSGAMLVMGLACPGYSGANPRNLQQDTGAGDGGGTGVGSWGGGGGRGDGAYYDQNPEAAAAQEERTSLWSDALVGPAATNPPTCMANSRHSSVTIVEGLADFCCSVIVAM